MADTKIKQAKRPKKLNFDKWDMCSLRHSL